ncbi:MAG: YfhO family protein [Bacteroidales bacterium]
MKQKPTQKPSIKPAIKVSSKKETVKTASKPFFLDQYMEKYGLWITLGLVSALIFIIFFDFIVGNKYYLFKDIGSDTINLSYPYMVHISNYLRADGFPKWSFASGMGKVIFPGGLGDPTSWIIYSLGAQKLVYGIILVESLKIFLTGFFFYKFLRLTQLGNVATVIGTLLFSLCGVMIVGGSWYLFSSEILYLSILLLAFEKLYQQNSWYLFPISIALIAMLQPFDIYLLGLFLITYYLFRILSSESTSSKSFFLLTLKMAMLTVVGLLISSFFIFASIQTIIDSPRVTGNSSLFKGLMSQSVFGFSNSIQYTSAIMRTFANDMLGNGSNFKGWNNYLESPIFYIGLLPLMLFSQVFPLINKKKKIVYAVFFAVYFLPIIFPYFRNAFWLFSGDYYRGYSIFFSLVLLLFSLEVIDKMGDLKKINFILLLLNLIIILLLLYYPYEFINQLINKEIQSNVTLFIIIYSAILFPFAFIKNKNALKYLLILTVCIELAYFNGKTVRDRDSITKTEWHKRIGYNDYTVEAVAYIKSVEKSFYRLNKDYYSGPAIHSSINDAVAQNYFGTASYDPFNQKYYIRFLEETGIVTKGQESQTRWASGLSTRPILQIIGSIKYNLTKKEKSFFQQIGYDSVQKFGDVKVLKNKYFLPIGFTYDSYIRLSQFQKLNTLQRDVTLLKAFVAEEPLNSRFNTMKEFNINDTTKQLTFDEISDAVKSRKADTMQITSFSNNHIIGKIDLNETRMLFLSIPYDKGWKIRVDNKPYEAMLCNIGFMGILLEKGEHVIHMDYEVTHMKLSLWLSLLGVFIFLSIIFFKNRKYILIKLSKKQF